MSIKAFKKDLLFYMNPVPMWIYHYPDLKIVEVNDAAILEFGYSRQKFCSMTTKDLRPGSEIPILMDVIKNGNLGCENVGIWTLRRKDGSNFNVELYLYTFEDEGELYKIGQIKKLDDNVDPHFINNLSKKALGYHLKKTPLLHLEWGSDLKIKSFSKDFLYKYHFTYDDLFNQSFDALIKLAVDQKDIKTANDLMNQVIQGKATKAQADIRFHDKKGNVIYSRWYSSILRNSSGEILSILTLIEDNTEYELAQKNLTHQNELINAIINSLPGIFYMIDENLKYVRWNKNFEKLLGVTGEEMEKRNMRDYYSKEELKFIESKLQETKKYGSVSAKMRIRDTKGINPLYQVTGINFKRDGRSYHLGMGVDISEIERAHQIMSDSLHEKEVLLAEVHHRVKNNLAMISGLLELANYNVQNREAFHTLKDATMRIKSMALIHEKLYQYKELSKIHMKNYTLELIHNIIKTMTLNTKIHLETEIDDVLMNVNQAIPVALILNELIINSLEHAFKGRNRGTIKVILKKKEGIFSITVCDDGIGISNNIDFKNGKSLGIKIVHTLAKQLKATLSIEKVGGTKISFSFKSQDIKGIANALFN